MAAPVQSLAGNICNFEKEREMETIDFLVHIDETLDESALEAIEDSIRDGKAVAAASHQASNPHIIQVVYDSNLIHANDIVQAIRKHGVHAQGLGL